MNTTFWHNFFRKDLNLKNRWWHRLLFVAFVVAFVAVVWGVIADTLNSAQLPKYTKVGILSDRVDAEIRLIGNLVQPGERIGVYEGNVYGNSYNQNGGWLLRQEYYCSKNISSKVEEISAKTEINYYKGNLDLVSLSDFKNYLAQNSALCVQVLGLDNPERYGNVKKALSWGLEADDMAVWAPSTVKSVFAVLQSVFFIALGFLVILILYYKVFLYIVFGKNAKL
ncbi:hypothetical protein COS21_02070 [bacterium (Candidatus Gribaldobacteria) CG02_land_8_20_14_3_00_41_15]|uniref:Uncharacterized protein n=1 Tax=bacterium (Candidatus Gribaldobacteria) CG02_land_8_20_14_3_00_41_15 TaxID=2014270 RepID=A0A2M7DDU9_9BACT|nr:MAG: hypothetical protein COS21_02070 [bacterium (Candidatus Gribaldobacteria) CG02_land_8_20_14_3_00_41_15]